MIHEPSIIVLYILGGLFFVVFVIALIATILATNVDDPLRDVHAQIARSYSFLAFIVGLILLTLVCVKLYIG